MRRIALVLALALASGCASARIGGRPMHGCDGIDGAMLTVRVGAPMPCSPELIPAGDPADPPGTAFGRAMVQAADWATEHPGWAAAIAIVTAALAAGPSTDWYGLADDDGGDGDREPIPASDREVEIDQTGSGNVTEVSVVQDGGTARPNVAIRQDGDSNVARIRFEPPE